jgi:hypothetical protein
MLAFAIKMVLGQANLDRNFRALLTGSTHFSEILKYNSTTRAKANKAGDN